MKQFEIFWIDLNPTRCFEIVKKRPCVIISPNELNYLQTRLVAPITSKGFDSPFRVSFELEGKRARILCDQICCVSVDRFLNKICDLESKKQEVLKNILLEMFS
ncbi:type II toxin-antitoxin system PemK/MazF family toxin [Helicobacter sp. MIT 14-3879]|uniref:type II toxin-antitoxin system PemK/MazF family toxin n=1 Tax=Helicobacter sp. MIT 14-3879 TaxID=2040649 RepID=UPI000E1E8288|nr:type II toxin-antitoxin system PemK/MazF family toxin [Helicobacter sp. MIT 14-3879]RDU59491.1 type II toxin-antitoxin system PemK/MazF family toxin [Helicobacter sp. MIT 14-3879]